MGCATSKQDRERAKAYTDSFNNLEDSVHVMKLEKPGSEKRAQFVPRETHHSKRKISTMADEQTVGNHDAFRQNSADGTATTGGADTSSNTDGTAATGGGDTSGNKLGNPGT